MSNPTARPLSDRIEHTFEDEREANKSRRALIDNGNEVTLIAFDPARDVFAFDLIIPRPELVDGFEVVEQTHEADCLGCAAEARSASIMAAATGSRGGSHARDRRDAASGELVVEHSATVRRIPAAPVQIARVVARIDMGVESWELTPTRTVREAVEQLLAEVNRLGHPASVYLVQLDAEDSEIGRYESSVAQPGDELADIRLQFA